jgi:hypothetical protein
MFAIAVKPISARMLCVLQQGGRGPPTRRNYGKVHTLAATVMPVLNARRWGVTPSSCGIAVGQPARSVPPTNNAPDDPPEMALKSGFTRAVQTDDADQLTSVKSR